MAVAVDQVEGTAIILHLKYDAAVSGHADAKNENELNKYRRTEAQASQAAEARQLLHQQPHRGDRFYRKKNVSSSMPAAAAPRSD